MKKTSSMIYKPDEVSEDLYLYTVNTGSLYRRTSRPIIENLARKLNKGAYDPERAIDAWYSVATEAAAMYNKELPARNFSVTTRYTVAVELESHYREEVEDAAEA